MQNFAEFFTLSDPNIRYVVLGTMLLTSSASLVGTFMVLNKKALLGDATAHAVFPGLCIAFMITGTKHPLYLSLGAFISGWMALLLIDYLTNHSKIKSDTAIALVLSVTFGIGTFLLSQIQNTANVAQIGLQHYLFGKAAALVGEDLWILSVLSGLIVLVTFGFFKEFTILAFDKPYARALGLPIGILEFIFTSLVVLSIVVGIRAVGIVLMSAMLITPAAAARFWTDKLKKMVGLAALFGACSGWAGSFISYVLPGMPTGPWIVLVATFLAYGSFFLAPKKGVIAKKIRQKKHQKKILKENILKLFYEMGEERGDFFSPRNLDTLLQHRLLSVRRLKKEIKNLQDNGLLCGTYNQWRLTSVGKKEGQQIVERHRLWEQYLGNCLHLNPDYTHENAEVVEHLLTPELVQDLNKTLKNTEF